MTEREPVQPALDEEVMAVSKGLLEKNRQAYEKLSVETEEGSKK